MEMRGLYSLTERALGKFQRLPLEVRCQVWLALKNEEHPYETHRRLKEINLWFDLECQFVLFAGRILTFDLTSYDRKPGRWPSEFFISDQFGCQWRVCPQLGGLCNVFEEGFDLRVLLREGFARLKRVRICISAPNDGGEMLMLWNRMRWVASFLHGASARWLTRERTWEQVDLHIEFVETLERSWWVAGTHKKKPIPYDLVALKEQPAPRFVIPSWLRPDLLFKRHELGSELQVQIEYGDCISFTLSPFFKWRKEVLIRFRSQSKHSWEVRSRPNQWRPPFYSAVASFLKWQELYFCPQWLRHALDALTTRSANLLRLELLATIDTGTDKGWLEEGEGAKVRQSCRTCIAQRDVACAYAPRFRNEMLEEIQNLKNWVLLYQMYGLKSQVEEVPAIFPNEASWANPLRRLEYEFTHRPYCADFQLACNMVGNDYHLVTIEREIDVRSKEALQAALNDETWDMAYGWPERFRQYEIYWNSLHHWRLEYPEGIPHKNTEEQACVMAEWQLRSVRYPPSPGLFSCSMDIHGHRCTCGQKPEVLLPFSIEKQRHPFYTPGREVLPYFEYIVW